MNLPPQAGQIAQQYGIPKGLFFSLISHESGGNPNAVSPAGAVGYTQLMPGTARGLGVDPHNPLQNLAGGAKYLRQMYDEFKSWALALAAYNAGPNAVRAAGGIPNFAETRFYVRTVLRDAAKYGAGGESTSLGSGAGTGGQNPGLSSGSGFLQALYGISQGQDPVGLLASLAPNPAAPQPATYKPSTFAGGFLPGGAMYKPGRADQGRDFQTNPGGPIIAPGAGRVVSVKSDPGGFGPSYPVVYFTSGPYKGRYVYIGHTISALKAGATFTAGTVLARTGTHPLGNASVPGWAEIGFAPGGVPGGFGQPTPFG